MVTLQFRPAGNRSQWQWGNGHCLLRSEGSLEAAFGNGKSISLVRRGQLALPPTPLPALAALPDSGGMAVPLKKGTEGTCGWPGGLSRCGRAWEGP